MKVVIVGGVAAGMSAATRLRRLREDAEIVVLERGEHVSFANCGLPYHLGGVIEERDALLLQTPESLARRFRLDVRTRARVVDVDAEAQVVTVVDERTGAVSTEAYDELVLAPGARPVVPDVPGADRALPLRDVADLDRLVDALDGARTAVVVGAGFVGLEVVENLLRRGLQVTLVERAGQVLGALDPELAVLVADRLAEHGVTVLTGATLTAVGPTTATVETGAPGEPPVEVPADLVVAAIGVRPETALARAAGAAVGPRGGILVDDDLRTTVPHVLAAGDAAEKRCAVIGGPVLVPLANLANRHGRHVADVIAGVRAGTRPAAGTAVVGVLGLTAAVTGRTETQLRAAGVPHRVIHTHPLHHAGYHPGARPLALKLLVDPATDRILGAQAVGEDGADKRIDVLATAAAGGLTASALADLELAYAPAYGSAKDPVNMLGYVADGLAHGEARTVQWHALDDALAAGAVLVDVRTPAEHAAGAVPGAVNVPLDELRARHHELGDRPVVVHCQVGQRGHTAARLLAQLGHDVQNLDGGYLTWSAGTRTAPSTTPTPDPKETSRAGR